MKFPRPLQPGDRIGVTSPSSGVAPPLLPRLRAGTAALERRGFDVHVGECMAGSGVVSAPKAKRAAELTSMLCDPEIRAVVPPWGGELAIDLLDELDWAAIAEAEPTWLVGWSDLSTVLLPLTLRLGWATLHGGNLMDTAYDAPEGLVHWVDLASATEPVTQRSPGEYRAGWDDYEADPDVSTMTLDLPSAWTVPDGQGVDVTGLLIGGCLDTIANLAGTPYGDVPAFGDLHREDGLIVYLEACDATAHDVARRLHGLRLAGWFDEATAVLIGRTPAPDSAEMTQHEAVRDALGGLDLPIVLDVDFGHTQPQMPLVNGALAHVTVDAHRSEITQTLA